MIAWACLFAGALRSPPCSAQSGERLAEPFSSPLLRSKPCRYSRLGSTVLAIRFADRRLVAVSARAPLLHVASHRWRRRLRGHKAQDGNAHSSDEQIRGLCSSRSQILGPNEQIWRICSSKAEKHRCNEQY